MLKTLNTKTNENQIIVDANNKRLIIEGYKQGTDVSPFCCELINMALGNKLEKIWLWSLPADVPIFLQKGFRVEGNLYRGNDEEFTVSLAYYVCKSRAISTNIEAENSLLDSIRTEPIRRLTPLPAEIELRLLNESFAIPISELLAKCFASYPTPVNNPKYLHSLFQKGNLFAGAFYQKDLIGVAAAYPDLALQRCEMTDCATLEKYRGYALSQRLLTILEHEIHKQGAFILYTLARAKSYGMNRVFHKLGYHYQGRLINNCHIGGSFEDMNLWIK